MKLHNNEMHLLTVFASRISPKDREDLKIVLDFLKKTGKASNDYFAELERLSNAPAGTKETREKVEKAIRNTNDAECEIEFTNEEINRLVSLILAYQVLKGTTELSFIEKLTTI